MMLDNAGEILLRNEEAPPREREIMDCISSENRELTERYSIVEDKEHFVVPFV
jgi:hypothetical protein